MANPILDGVKDNTGLSPQIQQLLQFMQGYQGNPWDEIRRRIDISQIPQSQLDRLQGIANQLRPLYNRMRGVQG